MAYLDFVRKIAEGMGTTAEALLSKPKTFVLNTNYRGRKTVQLLEDAGFPLKGHRTVDIGCAYGGISIEAARAGARVLGIDVVPRYVELAEANARGDVKAKFALCDATTGDFPTVVNKQLRGPVTRVIIHDVLEHIYDTPKLLENVRAVMGPGAALYFVVPNGRATRFVYREGHKKIYGLSVLDPDCWHYFLPGRPRIFYRRWAYFRSLLADAGLELAVDLTERFTGPDIRAHLAEEADRIEDEIDSPAPSAEAAEVRTEAVQRYLRELRGDIPVMAPDELEHKYFAEFWRAIYTLPALPGQETAADAPHQVVRGKSGARPASGPPAARS